MRNLHLLEERLLDLHLAIEFGECVASFVDTEGGRLFVVGSQLVVACHRLADAQVRETGGSTSTTFMLMIERHRTCLVPHAAMSSGATSWLGHLLPCLP